MPVATSSALLAKVTDQDHIARLRAARKRELLAVAREVEPEDLVGLEVGQLYGFPPSSGSDQMLETPLMVSM